VLIGLWSREIEGTEHEDDAKTVSADGWKRAIILKMWIERT